MEPRAAVLAAGGRSGRARSRRPSRPPRATPPTARRSTWRATSARARLRAAPSCARTVTSRGGSGARGSTRATPASACPSRGRGRSQNVVGAYDGPRRCLKIVMAHTDSVPAGPGAVDNASGVGVVVALARRLEEIRPFCDVWLVATGAEERPYTGQADHLGARRLVKHVRRERSARRLRYAFSLDMVGRGGRFQVSSPRGAPAAARRGTGPRGGPPAGRHAALASRTRAPATRTTASSSSPACPGLVIAPVARARALLPQRLRHVAAPRSGGRCGGSQRVAEDVLRRR